MSSDLMRALKNMVKSNKSSSSGGAFKIVIKRGKLSPKVGFYHLIGGKKYRYHIGDPVSRAKARARAVAEGKSKRQKSVKVKSKKRVMKKKVKKAGVLLE